MNVIRTLAAGFAAVLALGGALCRAADTVIEPYVPGTIAAATATSVTSAARAVQIAAAILAIGILTLIISWLMRRNKYEYEDPEITIPQYDDAYPSSNESDKPLLTP